MSRKICLRPALNCHIEEDFEDRSSSRAMEERKTYGTWSSPFCTRIKLALNLKGIQFEYAEEDLRQKSQNLLQFNPIYKKVPVLVHNGKPIAESIVILEYIEETWKEAPLLPEDPYERARVRFWVNFYDQRISPTIASVIRKEGEEQEETMNELVEKLCILEEGLTEDFSGGTPYLHGERPGILDIVLGSSLCVYAAIEEALGTRLIDPQRHPVILKWLDALKELPMVRETLPPHDMFVARIHYIREMTLGSAKASVQ